MSSQKQSSIPVIDIFAGPGGLGEGFAAFKDKQGEQGFRIALSIEKDPIAHQTLKLRSFFRQFSQNDVPDDYYRHLRGQLTLDELWKLHPNAAKNAEQETWRATLGDDNEAPLDQLRKKIGNALNGQEPWVLVGGPPCQAYSIIGRSRNKGKENYSLDKDPKTRLYHEYLQLIADYWPSVFVMENVKGLLSSKIDGHLIFDAILEDLQEPALAIKKHGRERLRKRPHNYRIMSLATAQSTQAQKTDPRDFTVKSEKYGIPQARHRVFLVGIREDVNFQLPTLVARNPVCIEDVIGDLPAIRSRLSGEKDGSEKWTEAVLELTFRESLFNKETALVCEWLKTLRKNQSKMLKLTCGGEYLEGTPCPKAEKEWYVDKRLNGFCNHSSRGHIRLDLQRYLFSIAHAAQHGKPPELYDFPDDLMPKHANAEKNGKVIHFADRFRVQMKRSYSTTVTSHLAKDGHYFIHYDPVQCRSFTAREVARLQTFPDSYFFEGPRTNQYQQIGNAVPPLLARQIAKAVHSLMT